MKTNEERLSDIFKKAADKKRRKKLLIRNAVAAVVCFVCTCSAVAIAVNDNKEGDKLPFEVSHLTETSCKSNATDRNTIVKNKTTNSAVSQPRVSADAAEPTETEPAAKPTHFFRPNENQQESIPQTTVPAPATVSPTVPTTVNDFVSQPTTAHVQPIETGSAAATQGEEVSFIKPGSNAPQLSPPQTELPSDEMAAPPVLTAPCEEPVQIAALSDDVVNKWLEAFRDLSENAQTQMPDEPALSATSDNCVYCSAGLKEKLLYAETDEVVRAKIYFISSDPSAVAGILNDNTVSFIYSGHYYIAFLTKDQVVALNRQNMPDATFVLIVNA